MIVLFFLFLLFGRVLADSPFANVIAGSSTEAEPCVLQESDIRWAKHKMEGEDWSICYRANLPRINQCGLIFCTQLMVIGEDSGFTVLKVQERGFCGESPEPPCELCSVGTLIVERADVVTAAIERSKDHCEAEIRQRKEAHVQAEREREDYKAAMEIIRRVTER